jgi:nucleoside 2-deoxyribosyltransferase
MKIYLAGPLFSTAERAFNGRPAGVVREMNIEVWLPQESEHGLHPVRLTPA